MAKKGQGPAYSAVIAADTTKMWTAVAEAANEAARDIIQMVNQYYSSDFPIVAAVMSMCAENMVSVTGEDGRKIYEQIKGHSILIAKVGPATEGGAR